MLKACESLFGAEIDSKEHLFNVNSLYVLKVTFDAKGDLNNLAVFPKHTDWTMWENKSFLSKDEYESLMTRLDGVALRGKRLASEKARMMENFTTRYLDQYEHSFIFRGEDIVNHGVIYLTLFDLHEIRGKIKKKIKCYYSDIEGLGPAFYYVVIGKREYLVPKDTYEKLGVGRTASFEAAGPLEETCDVLHVALSRSKKR